jgi:hypothetical protein
MKSSIFWRWNKRPTAVWKVERKLVSDSLIASLLTGSLAVWEMNDTGGWEGKGAERERVYMISERRVHEPNLFSSSVREVKCFQTCCVSCVGYFLSWRYTAAAKRLKILVTILNRNIANNIMYSAVIYQPWKHNSGHIYGGALKLSPRTLTRLLGWKINFIKEIFNVVHEFLFLFSFHLVISSLVLKIPRSLYF